MKKSKSSKPLLQWKLAYLDNGKRRLAITEEEDRELDEIIESHRRDADILWGGLLYMRDKLTIHSQAKNNWPREVAKELLQMLNKISRKFEQGYGVAADIMFLHEAYAYLESEISRRRDIAKELHIAKQNALASRMTKYSELIKKEMPFKDFQTESEKLFASNTIPSRRTLGRWKTRLEK